MIALAVLAACLDERPRPGPPILTVTFSTATPHVRDTVTGTVRAEDASGVDSIWLWLGQDQPIGQDGRFETVVQANFRLIVPASEGPGSLIPVQFRARDVEGFESRRDTSVRVVP